VNEEKNRDKLLGEAYMICTCIEVFSVETSLIILLARERSGKVLHILVSFRWGFNIDRGDLGPDRPCCEPRTARIVPARPLGMAPRT
jgi:hypothetical protein